MLKSTHRPAVAAAAAAPPPLAAGWTQHKAPTGHTYYYNAETKQSTYTRPVEEPEELQIDYDAKEPDREMRASMQVMQDFYRQNEQSQLETMHFGGGKSYQDRSRRARHKDRPKSKRPIKNCEPWVLVMTKFKRRFVHNLETKESLWKFPSEVMMAVIEMEKDEWQSKQNGESQTDRTRPEEASISNIERSNMEQEHLQGEDSDSYEEVEVTDDEDIDPSVKRLRMEDDATDTRQRPVEFDEDDIEWQLAQMEDAQFDEDGYGEDGIDEDDGGLPMTSEDSKALFRSLLDEMKVNPYSPFDNLLEDSNFHMIEDARWIALSNMSARRNAFADWSKDRIAEVKVREAADAKDLKKQDPRVQYLAFLQLHATTKLYWPEFKRKFKREPEIKGYDLSDKEREKSYRDYVAKLKNSEADRKMEFIVLLKSIPEGDHWNRTTKLTNLPEKMLQDIRFYLIRDTKARDDLVEAHLATLKD